MSKSRIIIGAVWIVVLLVFVSSVGAQTNKGSIKGTITDQNGAIVQNATVTVTNVATNTARTVSSGDDGIYEVPALEPGKYKVAVTAPSFPETVRENIIVQTASTEVVDVTLVAGQVGGVVTVTAAQSTVQSETSDLGSVIDNKQVTDLPIPQRNFTLLATLSPGVTRPFVGVIGGGGNFEAGGNPTGTSTESTRFRESGGSTLVVNGARPTSNNFTLDGADNNEGQFGQIGIYPPPDAIAEFKIQTSVAPAESGRAGGGIISTTTKSGTNAIHGTGYEFYQGRFWSALSRQDKRNFPTIPNRNTHQFGGTIGGPVFLPKPGEGGSNIYDGRNRSFFFFYYEGQRNSTPSTTGDFGFVSVPTARMRVGDLSELLQPGTTRVYHTINGDIVAPKGTVFCRTGLPAAGNDLRNCGQPLVAAALNVLQAYPFPTITSRIFDNWVQNRKERYIRNTFGVRADHRISQSDQIFFAISRDNSSRARDNNFPLGTSPTNHDLPSGFGAGNEFGNARGVRLGETHTFSPTVINDARFGATRVDIGIFNTGVGGALGFSPTISADLGIPNTNICGECTGSILLGIEEPNQRGRQNQLEFIGDGGPFYFKSNNFSFGDVLTWVRGNHTYKMGADYRVRQNANFDGGRAGDIKGQYQYGTSVCGASPCSPGDNPGGFLTGNFSGIPIGPRDSGSGIANFLFGYAPGLTTRGSPGTPPFLSNNEIGAFFQDDWKVTPSLTLNLGTRWDYFGQPTERFDRQTNYNPASDTLTRAGDSASLGRTLTKSDKNNFGPAVGFAWSGLKKDKTVVIRGGYALKYAVDTPGIPGILSANPPFASNYSCTFGQIGTASCPQLPASFNLDTGIPFPVSNITVTPGQSVTAPAGAALIFVDPNIRNEMFHQFNVIGQWEFLPHWLAEAGYVGSRGRNLLVVQNIGNGNGPFPGSRLVTTHSTVQEVEYIGKSWYDSLQTKVERRFTAGLSILSTYVWSKAVDNSPGNFCTGGTGPSTCGFSNPLHPELDKGRADFDVPHRFTFAAVYDLPFGRGRKYANNISRGADLVIGGWQANTDITIQSGPAFSIFASGTRADVSSSGGAGCKQFRGQFFCPPTMPVFANDPTGPKFGNSGRNIFHGDRQEYVNASLFKNLHATENFTVQLRAQAYNLFNHVNGFRPVNDINSSSFGIDTAEQRRRQLEFGVRLIF
jgi:hypothetical protein